MTELDALAALQKENARLLALLEANGIEWRLAPEAGVDQPSPLELESSRLSTDDKIALFRRLFRGRTDVYPIRWESKSTGKTGYAPACANEWLAGACEKPRIKCADCSKRLLIPLSDVVIYDHLAGKRTVGVYPLLSDDTCHFLAVDFDEAEWKEDALAFCQSRHELGVSAALEISHSGNGAHAWVFFSGSVSARDARRLGTAIISHTCARTRQLKLESYDRLFPNQDTMPISTPPQAYMDIISSQIDKARSLLEAGEKLQPFAFVGNLTTREIIPVMIQPGSGEDKDQSARLIQSAASVLDADFVFVIMEAWAFGLKKYAKWMRFSTSTEA
jgi:hypothetical protein